MKLLVFAVILSGTMPMASLSQSLVVETDKHVYTPGDTIRFTIHNPTQETVEISQMPI